MSLMGQADIVVLHHDGNHNDPDDQSAIVIGSLLTRAAGHQSKTHLFFGNNLAEPNNKTVLANVRAAADYAEQLGITTHDYQAGISRTTADLVKLLNSGKTVLMIEGGPMEATYRAMEQVSVANRDNITFVSHSDWNETLTDNTLRLNPPPRDWADLKRDFSDATFIDIADQNNNYRSSGWSWLDNTADPIFDLPEADEILGDGRAIMEDAGSKKNDASDAGMVAYALTGRQNFTPAETKQYLIDNWDNISAGEPEPEPEPEPTPTPNPGSGAVTFSLALAYDEGELVDGNVTHGEVLALDSLDDGRVTLVATPSEGVASVRMNLVGVHEIVENVSPYALFGDNAGDYNPGTSLGAGDYEMILTAYSGSDGSGSVLGSQTISFSVADQPDSTPNPAPDSEVVYRWNAGTGTVEAVDGGPDWMADAGAIVGAAKLFSPTIASLDALVPGTTPEGIFAEQYYGDDSASMGLEFGDGALEDGLYAVRLYMGDGYSETDDPGERVFDVSVEGELFLDDLDLSGTLGHQIGGMFEWRGTVGDGTVDIDFSNVVKNPLINGVEIVRLDGTGPQPDTGAFQVPFATNGPSMAMNGVTLYGFGLDGNPAGLAKVDGAVGVDDVGSAGEVDYRNGASEAIGFDFKSGAKGISLDLSVMGSRDGATEAALLTAYGADGEVLEEVEIHSSSFEHAFGGPVRYAKLSSLDWQGGTSPTTDPDFSLFDVEALLV